MGIAIYCSKPEKKEFLTLYTSKHFIKTLSIEIVYESKKCLVKSGKDIGQDGKKKYYVILAQVIRDTLQSITYYFAKYHSHNNIIIKRPVKGKSTTKENFL